MDDRRKAWLGSAATVVVIAAVILALWAFGSPRKQQPVPPTIALSAQQRSQQALNDGLAALSKDQTGTAIELLQSAVTINPDNTAARNELAKLTGGTSPASSSTTTPGKPSTSPTKTVVIAPAATWEEALNVRQLLPGHFAGYALGTTSRVGIDAVVAGSPTKPDSTVTRITWAVHDRGSDSKAVDFVNNTSKSLYKNDPATVVINGVPAYFATDGRQYATAVYTRGRYVFEVIVVTTQSPAKESSVAQSAAAAFVTNP